MISLVLLTFLSITSTGQSLNGQLNIEDDDLDLDGDIFNDFNEDLQSAQIIEDERFYRYGRFFTFNILLGLTSFDGNRGLAYQNDNPSYGLSLFYFLDFQHSFGLGISFSKHHMFIDQPTFKYAQPIGMIEISLFRSFFSYRYHIDTTSLGTAITYSNPYIISRLEYWNLTNKFISQLGLNNKSGGALGLGVGFGLEFPIEIKASYLGIEFLYHKIDFYDRHTTDYAPKSTEPNGFGYDNLKGNTFTMMGSYIYNW